MEPWQKEYITVNSPELIKNTNCATVLLAELRASKVLSDEDLNQLDTVKGNHGPTAQAKKFYDILQTRVSSYELVVENLHETNQSGVVKTLLTGYITHNKEIPPNLKQIYEEILPKKKVLVQDNEVLLPDFLKTLKMLNDSEFQAEVHKISMQAEMYTLVENVQKCFKNMDRYVSRCLLKNNRVTKELLTCETTDDVFVISGGINKSKLQSSIPKNADMISFEEQEERDDITAQFILIDMDSDFASICTKAEGKNIHHLEFKADFFYWIETFGNKKIIFDHIERQYDTITESDFLNYVISNSNKSICISGTAGMGKTKFLQNLAYSVKHEEKDILVFFFVFQEFLNQLYKNGEDVVVTKQMIKNAIASKYTNSPFSQQVVVRMLSNFHQKVYLFLDGFDELAHTQIGPAKQLLQQITTETKNVRLFVTTRPHMLEQLEECLGTPGFSVAPLNQQEQIEMMTKYWKAKNFALDEPTLREYASKIIQAAESETSDNTNNSITAEPMQCFLLGKINKERVARPNFQPDKNGYSKYTMFQELVGTRFKRIPESVDYKILFGRSFKSVNKEKRARNIAKDVHVIAAFDLMFPKSTETFIKHVGIEYSDYTEIRGSKVIVGLGLLEASKDGPKFVHRLYAEFLLAEFIVNILSDMKILDSSDGQTFVLFFLQSILDNVSQVESFISQHINGIHSKVTTHKFQNSDLNYFLNAYLEKDSKLLKENQELLLGAFTKLSRVGQTADVCHNFPGILSSCTELSLRKIFELILLIAKAWNPDQVITLEKDCLVAAARCSDQDLNSLLYKFLRAKKIAVTNNTTATSTGTEQITPLQTAVHRGNFSAFRVVFNNSEQPYICLLHFCLHGSMNDEKRTILDKIEIINYLLEENAVDVNEKTKDGNAPLLSLNAHDSLIEHLISKGADVNLTNNSGESLLHIFLKRGEKVKIKEEALVKFLEMVSQAGFRFERWHDAKIVSPLVLALRNAIVGKQALEMFKLGGSDFHWKDENGENLLFVAVRNQQNQVCIKQLMSYGLEYDERNGREETLLHVATEIANFEAAFLLLEMSSSESENHAAFVNAKDEMGNTPLHVGLMSANTEMHGLLLQHGADLNAFNNENLTPLQRSFKFCRFTTVTTEKLENFDQSKQLSLRPTAEKLLACIFENEFVLKEMTEKGPSTDKWYKMANFIFQYIPITKLEGRIENLQLHVKNIRRPLGELISKAEESRLKSLLYETSGLAQIHNILAVMNSAKSTLDLLNPVADVPTPYVSRTLEAAQRKSVSQDILDFGSSERARFGEDQFPEKINETMPTGICVFYSSSIGLTCLFRSLARKIQNQYPEKHVGYLHLSHFIKKSGDDMKIMKASKLVLNHISTSSFASRVLEIAMMNGGEFEIFIDGFAEESGNTEQITDFLWTLSQEMQNTRIYIATRPHKPCNFEDTSKVFSCSVLDFSEQENLSFLAQFWRRKFPSSSQKNVSQVMLSNIKNSMMAHYGSSTKTFLSTHVFLHNDDSKAELDESKEIMETYLQCPLKPHINILRKSLTENSQARESGSSNGEAALNLLLRSNASGGVYALSERRGSYVESFHQYVNDQNLVAGIILNAMCGQQADDAVSSQEPLAGHLFEKALSIKSNLETKYGEVFNILKLSNPVKNVCAFENSAVASLLNESIKEKANPVKADFVKILKKYSQPSTFYQILQACTFHCFDYLLFSLLKLLVDNTMKDYKDYLTEGTRAYQLLMVSFMYANKKIIFKLQNFYSNHLQYNWKEELYNTPQREVTPFHVAGIRGNFDVMASFDAKPERIKERGIIHAVVLNSLEDDESTLMEKSKIIKLLADENNLVNEKWHNTLPVYSQSVSIELIKCLILNGADVSARNEIGDNFVQHILKQLNMETFCNLTYFLAENNLLGDLFVSTNSSGKIAFHEVLTRFPNIYLRAVKVIAESPHFDLYSVAKYDKNSILFHDLGNQSEGVQQYLLHGGLDHCQTCDWEVQLLDKATELGNPLLASVMCQREEYTGGLQGRTFGNTALHLAAKFLRSMEFRELVASFLEQGKTEVLFVKNAEGVTPIDIAKNVDKKNGISGDFWSRILQKGGTVKKFKKTFFRLLSSTSA